MENGDQVRYLKKFLFIEFNRAFRDRIEMKSISLNQKKLSKNILKTISTAHAGSIISNNNVPEIPFSFNDLSPDLNKYDDK